MYIYITDAVGTTILRQSRHTMSEDLQQSYEFHSKALNELKKCKQCEKVKTPDYFYKIKGRPMTICISCHNAKRKLYRRNRPVTVKKKTGFAALEEAVQNDIIYSLHIKLPSTIIAKNHNIKYNTLCTWRKRGQIPTYDESTQ